MLVITTLGSAYAALEGIRSLKDRKFSVKSLQDYAREECFSDGTLIIASWPDQTGIVATGRIHENGGNVLHADQHLDRQENIFFQRVEWCPLPSHDLRSESDAFSSFANMN